MSAMIIPKGFLAACFFALMALVLLAMMCLQAVRQIRENRRMARLAAKFPKRERCDCGGPCCDLLRTQLDGLALVYPKYTLAKTICFKCHRSYRYVRPIKEPEPMMLGVKKF